MHLYLQKFSIAAQQAAQQADANLMSRVQQQSIADERLHQARIQQQQQYYMQQQQQHHHSQQQYQHPQQHYFPQQ
jgi:hypothetical protein